MTKESELSHKELLTILEKVRYSTKEETKLEVAECMLDYGIDIALVGAVTGLKKSQLLSRKYCLPHLVIYPKSKKSAHFSRQTSMNA